MAVLRWVREHTAPIAFALLTVAYVSGQVQLNNAVNESRDQSRREDIALCRSQDQTNAGARGFIHTVVSTNPARRDGETDDQYTLRVEQLKNVLKEADKQFPDLTCPGDKSH